MDDDELQRICWDAQEEEGAVGSLQDLELVGLRAVAAAAWDEGHSDGLSNSTEGRPWRILTNPYKARA